MRFVWPDTLTGAFDRDSNGLADIAVTWHDAGGGVDPASVRITCINCVPGVAADTNLAKGWRLLRADSAGAEFEETIPLMMSAGDHLLGVSVADAAGNRSGAVVAALHLPPGSYHRTIDLRYPAAWRQERATNLVLTADGRKGFVPFIGGNVAVFDPDGVALPHYIRNVPNSPFAADISLDSATGLAYIAGGGAATSGFTILDTWTEQVLRTVPVGLGAAGVAVRGTRIFAGEDCTTGRVFVYDKTTLAQVGKIEVGAAPWNSTCVNSVAFALTRDGRSGWAGLVAGDLYAFDGQTLALRQRYDLTPPPGDGIYGDVRDMVLVADRWLYLARVGQGLEEFDTPTGRVTAHYPVAEPLYAIPKMLALSPDHRLLFACTDPGTTPGTNQRAPVLFTVPGLQVRFAFPPRPGICDGVVFHPDGKRVYQMAEYAVEVYLVRPY